jgi:type IV pilus biogenesis protein CpaD/CtpE
VRDELPEIAWRSINVPVLSAIAAALLAAALSGCATPSTTDSENLASVETPDFYKGA